MDGLSLLGVGFASPYVRAWTGSARRCVVATPSQVGAVRWPTVSGNLTCTMAEDALPFPDLCFDRIVVVHGLEAVDSARSLLREVWRVLKDDGRLLVVAPNRVGLWAHVESTPFGHGQPYSPGQIGRLLASSMFRVERRETALNAKTSTEELDETETKRRDMALITAALDYMQSQKRAAAQQPRAIDQSQWRLAGRAALHRRA